MRMAGEGGYEAVQMRAVAEESGVALGTIYRYYSGKDEMLIAGLAGWLRRSRRRVESGRSWATRRASGSCSSSNGRRRTPSSGRP